MNATELFNDHTLHILLDDLVKARKSADLGPIRLQAFLDYAEKKSGTVVVEGHRQEPRRPAAPRAAAAPARPRAHQAAAPAAPGDGEAANLLMETEPEAAPKRRTSRKKAPFNPIIKDADLPPGFADPDEAAPAPAQGYLAARMAERKDPIASLKQAADIVEAAIKENRWDAQGQMQVLLPKGMVVSGLEAILKDRRAAFTKLIVSLPPKNAEISAKTFAGLHPGVDEKRMRGAQGERTAGWAVLVMK
ncbi:MAG: hypothetical protein KGL39_34900 [Patescibacteria group bacterium]|nr:hypothetical protein [Patescibacteria group bacterium]